MTYRRLGRTGLMISEIALGGSPLPDERLLLQLVERGVNYIDTSDSYENGNCERKVGRLFKAVGRENLHIHGRFHLVGRWTEGSIIASVEKSLRRLETDFMDILGIHGVENPDDLTDERILGAYEKLKGTYRFRGLTCHANQHAVIPRAVESGLYDMVQVGYNVFDLQETETNVRTYGDYLGESGLRRLIDLCHGKGVGVTAMKTLKVGGRRQDLAAYKAEGLSVHQAMLKWVLENDQLAAAVIEIMNEDEMAEDLAVSGKLLTEAERRMLRAHVAENAGNYCHLCGSCQAACPAGIRTADISRGLAYRESYAKTDRAKAVVAAAASSSPLSNCRDCGACEKACLYGLPVRERTRRAAGLLG
ncbi:MAG: 4Fe-4S dicluster domain-containing protein [Candidatus Aminicenantes bacterium]|nr:4Fe-4S dicluster domain-containing protein [Candidatus Aminicenantes bacterium]